jgi:hypothetical protein
MSTYIRNETPMRSNEIVHSESENKDTSVNRASSTTLPQFDKQCTAMIREHSLSGNPLSDASTTISMMKTTMHSMAFTMPCMEMTRQHSLAGHPLPDTSISTVAPPPSTLCPFAIEHKFPFGHRFKESPEDFLKSCLRQTSLDLDYMNDISSCMDID